MIIKKENKRHKLLKKILIGFLLIIVGITIFGYDKAKDEMDKKEEKIMIEEFFDNDKEIQEQNYNGKKDRENYIAIIEIPKISLKTGMVDPNSKSNIVDKHVQILNKSSFPNVNGGNFILASHSGTSNVSYFKKLNKLVNEDIIYIYYENMKYTYQVYKIYKVDKNGLLSIKNDSSKTILTLTTCDTTDDAKQLVVLAKQVSKEKIN